MRNLTLSLLFLAAVSACGGGGPDAPPVIRGISYVGMSVRDLDASRRFYSSAANLHEANQSTWSASPVFDELTGRDAVSVRSSLLRSSNAQLRLMEFANRSPAAERSPEVAVFGPGIAHVCFQTAQDTETYQKFIDNGAVPVGATELVHLNPRRPVWYAYSRDADGIMFEVEHVDIAALELPEPPKHDRRIRHVSISTPDLKRTLRFYEALLDNDKPRRIGRLFGGVSGDTLDAVSGLKDVKISMAWFQVGNLELEIFQYKSHPTEVPSATRPLDALGYNMIVFDVADVESAQAKIAAAGGTIVTSPKAKDGGMIFFGRDPDGNLLGFQTTEPGSLVSTAQFENQGI